ncbi:ATP-binding cassette domain-containing protein [Paenibacillus rhizoplanae]
MDSPGITIIAGRSGSGKSTLVKLICGYDRPSEGSITLFGHDLAQPGFHSIAPLVSFVPQEPYIFPVSILDNIGYGRLNATREEVIAAATAAGVHRCVSEWPDGYDTVVSGEELSGGQRQRISIARALLKGTPVLQKETAPAEEGRSKKLHWREPCLVMQGEHCTDITATRP